MFGVAYLLSGWRQRYACNELFVGNLILYNFRLKQFSIDTKVSILLLFYLKVSIRIDTKFFRYFNTTTGATHILKISDV